MSELSEKPMDRTTRERINERERETAQALESHSPDSKATFTSSIPVFGGFFNSKYADTKISLPEPLRGSQDMVPTKADGRGPSTQ